MAELGDFLLGMGDPDVDKINVDVNMLDYDYVAKCDRITELKAILKVLTVSYESISKSRGCRGVGMRSLKRNVATFKSTLSRSKNPST